MNTSRLKTFIPVVITLFLYVLFAGKDIPAQTDFYGVIRDSGGTVPQLNVAVAKFDVTGDFFSGDEPEKAVELKERIENGLAFALYFNVVTADSSLMALIGEREMNYEDWIYLGAEHLIGGSFYSDGILFHYNLEITDILRGKTIYTTEFKAPIDSVNQLSYRAVDRIINILTGEKGISFSRLVFSAASAKAKELAICNWDGSDLIYLTDNNSLNLFPTADPSGEEIYFTSYFRGNPDLYRLNLLSSELAPISARKGIDSSPAISPDGEYIALILTVDDNAELYLLTNRGRIVRRLTRTWGIESSPAFSPNGREIVFSSDKSGPVHLYVTDIEGLNQRRLTFHGNYNDTPSWSPKGDLITYASRESGRFQIYTMSITGENIRRLTSVGNNQDPCFSPDGLHICFVSDRTGAKEVYTMNFDGSNQKRVTSVESAFNPYWAPGIKGD